MAYVAQKVLEDLVTRINQVTGESTQAYLRDEWGELHAQEGHYQLLSVNGFYSLVRLRKGGGVLTIIDGRPKSQLLSLLKSLLLGIEIGKRVPNR